MARDVTARHAVYGTWDHKRGASLSVPPGPLVDLLKTADHALDRQSGGFFETIEDRFVVGFEGERREGTKGRMRYFDLFTLPVADVADCSVGDLFVTLRSNQVDSYEAEPTPEELIEVAPSRSFDDERPAGTVDGGRSGRADETTDPSAATDAARTEMDRGDSADGSDGSEREHRWDAEGEPIDRSGESTASGEAESDPGSDPGPDSGLDVEPEPNDPASAGPAEPTGCDGTGESDERFVAQMWEQIRRDSFQCRANLDDVDRFVDVVDGALREVSFVTADRIGAEHFDVVGADELEYVAENTETLERRVRELAEAGDLTYEALPTYREELRSLRERKRRAVHDDDELRDNLESSTDEFRRRLTDRFTRVNDRAAELMEMAERGALETDDDDTGFARLRGFVGGDADDPALLPPEAYAELDRETVTRIDSELRQEREQARETLEDELLPKLEDRLVELLESWTTRTAKEAAEGLDETRRSEVYERADLDADDAR